MYQNNILCSPNSFLFSPVRHQLITSAIYHKLNELRIRQIKAKPPFQFHWNVPLTLPSLAE